MRIVLDASAAVNMILQLPGTESAWKGIHEAEWIECPDLMIAETANACWKHLRSGAMKRDECEALMADAIGLADQFVSAEDLYQEAFALAAANKRAAYDMFYLALARRHNALLITFDKGLQSLAAELKIKTLK